MPKDLKDSWKDTGVSLGHAFRDLGKTLIKTGATAIKKADNWANNENEPQVNEESTEDKE